MKTMLEQVKWVLLSTFGNRVAFNDIERTLYSAEPAGRPGITATPGSLPDAVVQPRNASELAALVKIGRQYRVPLVPRGTGTADGGGAFPIRDLRHFPVPCQLKRQENRGPRYSVTGGRGA